MLERSAEGAAREALRPRVPRDVAARHRQADQRDRQGDGPLAQHRQHLPHPHPAQAQPDEQRGAGALRGQAPAGRMNPAATALSEASSAQGLGVPAVADSMIKSEAVTPAHIIDVDEAVEQAKILIVDDEPKSLYAL